MGGGETNIRKRIFDKDWLECVVALPERMFCDTGIGRYIPIVTNRKAEERKGGSQLVDPRVFWIPMYHGQADKRRKIVESRKPEGNDRGDEPDQSADIVRLYGDLETNDKSKLFDNKDFGYTRVTIVRP